MTSRPGTGGHQQSTHAKHPKVFHEGRRVMCILEADKTCIKVFGIIPRFLKFFGDGKLCLQCYGWDENRTWYQCCGAGIQISGSGSGFSSGHLNVLAPAPTSKSFWLRLLKDLVEKTLYYLYNSLVQQTMTVEREPKFQASAPAPAIQNCLGSGSTTLLGTLRHWFNYFAASFFKALDILFSREAKVRDTLVIISFLSSVSVLASGKDHYSLPIFRQLEKTGYIHSSMELCFTNKSYISRALNSLLCNSNCVPF